VDDQQGVDMSEDTAAGITSGRALSPAEEPEQ
jgi:hypothetical protein